jgi:hypothetical protein
LFLSPVSSSSHLRLVLLLAADVDISPAQTNNQMVDK